MDEYDLSKGAVNSLPEELRDEDYVLDRLLTTLRMEIQMDIQPDPTFQKHLVDWIEKLVGVKLGEKGYEEA